MGGAALLFGAAGFASGAVVCGVLAAYVLWFFRDPERQFTKPADVLCAPADGKVVSVLEVPCDRMPGGRAMRIAIFLNVFNVHVQRAPAAGRVIDVERRAGKFLNALNEKCSEENERVTTWLRTPHGVDFGVRQIAGAIARRIVPYIRRGDRLDRGERLGLIQFGSRVEVFLPIGSKALVRAGQNTVAGRTPLARFAETRRG